MAGYNYNINLNVIVKDQQLSALEKRINKLNNTTIKPKFDSSKVFDEKSTNKFWNDQNRHIQNFQREQSNLARNMSSFGRDFSQSATQLNRSVEALRQTNSLGRRMGVAREKGSRLMDVGAGVGSYIGLSSLKKVLYDIPVQAETNKWLMSTMGDETASSDSLYKQLDMTTDRLPISMQSVAQPLYAFKAATGENAQVIKDIIPQFANFGAVVQNMTGSTELAETAMMKLGYGIKGRYAALDQYGITEDALKRNGWSGDENDVKGYMAAVTKIVGNAEGSMGTFAGKVKLVEKSLARAGKGIWESGVGDALKGVLSFVSAFLDAGDGIFAKLGVAAVGGTSAFLGIVAASGYLMQTIGSMGESFLILKSTIGDVAGYIGTKFGATSTIKSLEQTLTAQQNPVYVGGIHDYSRRDLANSGFSQKELNKINTSKRRDKSFVRNFGYGAETERRIKAVRSDPTMKATEKRSAIKNIRKSRLNEINQMGFVGRVREVGFRNSMGSVGGAFKQGFNANTGLSKVTGGFKSMGTVLGSLIGVINPFNVVLAAFGVAIGSLAAVFAIAYTSSDQFRQHVARVGQKLMSLAQTFSGFLGDVFQMVGLSTEGGIDGVVEVADNVLSAIESGFDWLKGVMEGFTGKDYYADEQYKKHSKGKDEAEAQIKELQRAGKEVPKELYDTMNWNYSRMAYFSKPDAVAEQNNPTQGGYWKDKGGKYDQIREANPGWQFSNYSNPKEILQQQAQYMLGDLGIWGLGQARTYNSDVQTQQASNKGTVVGDEVTLNSTGTGESFESLGESAMQAAVALDMLSGNDTSIDAMNNSVVTQGQGILDLKNNSGDLGGQELVNKFHDQVMPGVNATLLETNNAINNNTPMASAAASNVGTSAANSLDNGMSSMPTYASQESGKVSSQISNKTPQVSGASGSMGSSAGNSFGNNLDLVSWASSEISSMIDKINARKDEVASAFGELAAAGYNALERMNDNNSPGKIARWGGREVKWMAESIRKRSPGVVNALGELTNSLIPHKLNNFDINTLFWEDNVQSLMNQNPVDIYRSGTVTVKGVKGTPSIGLSETKPPKNSENNQVINLTFNIEKVDSESRVQEIKDVIYETLLFNNETAGRQEPSILG